jgi:hypothetical protein
MTMKEAFGRFYNLFCQCMDMQNDNDAWLGNSNEIYSELVIHDDLNLRFG